MSPVAAWFRNFSLVWAGVLIAHEHFWYALLLCVVAGVLDFVADYTR